MPSRVKNIGIRRKSIVFEACESKNLIHSVPFPRLGISGALFLEISYFIVLLIFRRIIRIFFCHFVTVTVVTVDF